MIWLAAAWAAPEVVVSFDNGGFNLPLYTKRWNGSFEQPSVAQQLSSDLARALGKSPRVFSYLPPGSAEGSSSEPFEVLPTPPECADPELCGECAPGDRCWEGLSVNRHPAASTSLYQAAKAIREKVPVDQGRLEIHFTDLFEEDPTSASHPSDADRCVTEASTRKAVEALIDERAGSLDHVAVGILRARIAGPRRAEGGLTRFVERGGGCWSAERSRTFGGDGRSMDIQMAVVVLGYGTAPSDSLVRTTLQQFSRQVTQPLALDLVVVREPAVHLEILQVAMPADQASAALPLLPELQVPCEAMTVTSHLQSEGASVPAKVRMECDGGGAMRLDSEVTRRVFRRQAGLNPLRNRMLLDGTLNATGDVEPVLAAVESLPNKIHVEDRPLVFWSALRDALRFGTPRAVARPRTARVDVRGILLTDIDDRPWWMATLAGLFFGLLAGLITSGILARVAANRAFRARFQDGGEIPLGAMLEAASVDAREGWSMRFLIASSVGLVVGSIALLMVIVVWGVLGG